MEADKISLLYPKYYMKNVMNINMSRVSSNRAVGGYARSEADLEQIMDGLHEQEVI